MDQPSSSRRMSAVEIPSSSPPRPRRPSTQAGPSRKRRRLSHHTVSSTDSQPTASQADNEPIESIDLTDVDGTSAIAKVLAKQREEAVDAQPLLGDSGDARSRLTAYKCPICLESPTNATTTICGHLFCHECIMSALKHSEEQRADHAGKSRGACPKCRAPLTRVDAAGTKRNLIPLQIKLHTRKRNVAKNSDTS
ncbi:hypothetical protein BDV18DRAFT_164241 [Aspergillus unguis]